MLRICYEILFTFLRQIPVKLRYSRVRFKAVRATSIVVSRDVEARNVAAARKDACQGESSLQLDLLCKQRTVYTSRLVSMALLGPLLISHSLHSRWGRCSDMAREILRATAT